MTDEIQRWTSALAADPDSLVFLELGEALRRRKHLDGALAVARSGVARYPQLAEAHDLLGRVHSDRGEGDEAFDAWTTALRIEPRMVGPLKGLGFLFYRVGDYTRSLRQLEAAARLAPDDPAVAMALARVRERLASGPAAEPPAAAWEGNTMLADHRGRILAGRLEGEPGADPSEAVAARLAGVGREAARTVQLLGLGQWQSLMVEGAASHLALTEPADGVLLVVRRPADTPPGQLALLAERAGALARRWLEQVR